MKKILQGHFGVFHKILAKSQNYHAKILYVKYSILISQIFFCNFLVIPNLCVNITHFKWCNFKTSCFAKRLYKFLCRDSRVYLHFAVIICWSDVFGISIQLCRSMFEHGYSLFLFSDKHTYSYDFSQGRGW